MIGEWRDPGISVTTGTDAVTVERAQIIGATGPVVTHVDTFFRMPAASARRLPIAWDNPEGHLEQLPQVRTVVGQLLAGGKPIALEVSYDAWTPGFFCHFMFCDPAYSETPARIQETMDGIGLQVDALRSRALIGSPTVSLGLTVSTDARAVGVQSAQLKYSAGVIPASGGIGQGIAAILDLAAGSAVMAAAGPFARRLR